MTDQEQQELNRLLYDWWHKKTGDHYTPIGQSHLLTDLNWLFELLWMLDIYSVRISTVPNGYKCFIYIDGKDKITAIAPTPELAIAMCEGWIIKEMK